MLDFLDIRPRRAMKMGINGLQCIQWTWQDRVKARWMRETEGLSYPEISKTTGIPERTLQSWAQKEVWKKKGEDAPLVEQWTRTRFLELAAANGMPKQRALGLLVEGMTKPVIETTEEKEVIGEDGQVSYKKEFKQLPDYATRHKFQKDYWVLAGMYSTNKQMEINNQGEGTVNVQVIIPEKDK